MSPRGSIVARVTLVLAGLATAGCITGFAHPLGPVSEGFIEPGLVGAWTCTAAEGAKPGSITIVQFDSRQYYVEFGEGEEPPTRFRAVATSLEDLSFLSIHEIGGRDDGWEFLSYILADADHLQLRAVDPQPFEDIVNDPASVRQRLAERLQDPDILADFQSCTRTRKEKP
jgi:hypothetical protein